MTHFFKKAKPIWIVGEKNKAQNDMNMCAEARYTALNLKDAVLTICGASFYQVFVNSKIVCFGPARTARGVAAVDTVKLADCIKKCEIIIRVLYCGCRNFRTVMTEPYLCAEIINDGEVSAATGVRGFEYFDIKRRLKKTMRYSFQREFTDSWDYTQNDETADIKEVECKHSFVQRNVPSSDFEVKFPESVEYGEHTAADTPSDELYPYLIKPSANYDCYPFESLETKPYVEYLNIKAEFSADSNAYVNALRFDFKKIQTGFLRFKVKSQNGGRIIAAFGEQLGENGRINMRALNSVNIVEWRFPSGKFEMITTSPYTARYIDSYVTDGDAEVSPCLVEVAFPKDRISNFVCEDKELDIIYRAGVRSFRHNVLDIYMDCPSRERAGWLFDSYYTAKAEYGLTGKSVVEKAFLENYINGGNLKNHIGMVSMCYPADVFSGSFVPQWSLWYILEIYEYVTERHGEIEKEMFRTQVCGILDYFKGFENEYGLLERLDGWNFVEWSKLNDRVFDVSWPTNMLYAAALDRAAELFGISDYAEKSKRLKQTICDMAYNGVIFADRAVRNKNGELVTTDEVSQTAQYYALKFKTVPEGDERFERLKDIILKDRESEFERFGEVEPADVLPGMYIKMELLLKWGAYDRLKQEIKRYFLCMARQTSTLWERKNGKCSLDHGFASYICVLIKSICGE